MLELAHAVESRLCERFVDRSSNRHPQKIHQIDVVPYLRMLETT